MRQQAHRAARTVEEVRKARTAEEVRKAGPRAGADQDEAALVAGGAAAEIFAGQPAAAFYGSLVCRQGRKWREIEVCPTAIEVLLAVTIGEKSAVADADKAVGQDVEEESVDEFSGM